MGDPCLVQMRSVEVLMGHAFPMEKKMTMMTDETDVALGTAEARARKTVAASRVEISRLMRPQDGRGISIVSENPQNPGSGRRTNRSFITMVAVDDAGKSVMVPELVHETAEDEKWRCESELRKDLRRRYREQIEAGACIMSPR